MSNRYLIGGGTLILAAAAAFWYAAGAPSRGLEVEPGADSVVVSAVQAGSGSWVRYTVTLANSGDLDFDGSVLLQNSGTDAAAARAAQISDLAAPARGGRFPSVAPDAAYQVHVRVPARKQRIISMTTPDQYGQVLVKNREGAVLIAAPVEAAGAIPIAVMSDNGAVAQAVAQVQAGDFRIRVLDLGAPRSFPVSAAQLNGFAAIVIDRYDTGALSRQQVGALRDFVGLGGSLVIATGGDWRRTLAGLPPELLPLAGRGSGAADLGEMAALSGLAGDFTAPILTGEMGPAAIAVAGTAARPLLVEGAYGAGRIEELAFDPAAEPVSSSRLAPAAWGQAVTRALNKAPGSAPAASALPGPVPVPDALFPAATDPPLPPPAVVGLVLLGYLLLVGPANLVLSRRLRKPDLLWVTTPLIAVVATGSFWAVGTASQGGNRDDVVQVLKAAPNGSVAELEFHRVLFHRRGDHRLTLPSDSVVAPLTLPVYLTTGTECSRCVLQLTGLRQNVEEHVLNSVPPQVAETGVAYGNVRIVGSLSLQRQTAGVEAHLAARSGMISGTVRNLGSSPIRQLSLYSFDGEVLHRTLLAAELGPGRSQSVAGRPETAESTGGSRGRPAVDGEQLLANSLARSAMSWDSRPLLLGSVDPRPSRLLVDGRAESTASRGFLEQPIRVEAADSLLADFAQVRLAAHSGDQRTGFLNVYDLELPRRLEGGLTLSVDRNRSVGLEIFDWGSGSWRGGPFADDPSNAARQLIAASAGEVSAGLVRVRLSEARTSWGAFLTIK